MSLDTIVGEDYFKCSSDSLIKAADELKRLDEQYSKIRAEYIKEISQQLISEANRLDSINRNFRNRVKRRGYEIVYKGRHDIE